MTCGDEVLGLPTRSWGRGSPVPLLHGVGGSGVSGGHQVAAQAPERVAAVLRDVSVTGS